MIVNEFLLNTIFHLRQQTRDSGDYARLAAEVRQLRDDESQLRQENLQLKVNKLLLTYILSI